jgi:hypothetical protein
MKRILIIIILLLMNYAGIIYAQDIFHPEIESLLSPAQKQELERAVNILLKARGNENNANDIERKYSKLKMKGKFETWSLKTWEAKQQRIMAEKNYKNAYNTISNVYSELISNGKYENDQSKMEALSLDKEAKSKFSDAEGFLSQYSETTKENLEQTPNEQVDSTLRESHLLKLNGIELQIAALDKIIGIGKQSGQKNDDELAWAKAKSTNTISSYYEYLNSNPRGSHMMDANDMVSKIEQQDAKNDIAENNANKNNKNPRYNANVNENGENKTNLNNNSKIKGNLTFKVQIAAAKSEISEWMLSVKAPGLKNIEMVKSEGWIKYMVGEFGTYTEAAEYRNELRSHVPDAFIVVFNDGAQIEVTNEMKL